MRIAKVSLITLFLSVPTPARRVRFARSVSNGGDCFGTRPAVIVNRATESETVRTKGFPLASQLKRRFAMWRIVGFGFAAIFVLSAAQIVLAAANQKAARLDKEIRVTMDYLLYLPPNYEAKDKWPLMLFLHGAGERGSNLDMIKKHGPPS
jgi:hypothetical protein